MGYVNDFAERVGESLGERVLSERLSSPDPFGLADMSLFGSELMGAIDRRPELYPEPRSALPGDEFYVSETTTVAFPIGISARNLAEFLDAIRHADRGCLYNHFFEARVPHGSDGFYLWSEDVLRNKELAAAVRAIDPFIHRTEGIRKHMVEAVEKEIRKEMEEVMVS